jgi:hypothetical protein
MDLGNPFEVAMKETINGINYWKNQITVIVTSTRSMVTFVP